MHANRPPRANLKVKCQLVVEALSLFFLLQDSGTFRILWSTFQIVRTITWSIDVELPSPFRETLEAIAFVSFDIIRLECFGMKAGAATSVTLSTLFPILIAVLSGAVYFVRDYRPGWSPSRHLKLVREHAYFLLLLSYLVVPPVTHQQFQAMDCFTVSGLSVLRSDSSISCDDEDFKRFQNYNWCFLVLYLSIPLIWLRLLWRKRERLVRKDRDAQSGLQPYRFLYGPYRRDCYATEVAESFRRILFAGVVPLISQKSDRSVAFGTFLALTSLIVYREVAPFELEVNNILNYVAQLAIFVTYAGALVLETNLADGADPLIIGIVLCLVNFFVLCLAFSFSAMRFYHEEKSTLKWLRVMTTG